MCIEEALSISTQRTARADGRTPGRPRASREEVMARVLPLMDQPQGPVRLVDLCRAAGVSERTLRTIFKEQFGLGPNRYLRMRRLALLASALANADPHNDTVAAIAARFGYTHGGRMASEYRALFGEHPHATLGRHAKAAAQAPPSR
jgi:transcriptional regulator GlxA family with amidase domain